MILDISLADGNGLSLIGYLKAKNSANIPVVILAADYPPEYVYDLVDAVIVKSRLAEDKIVSTILTVLATHKNNNLIS
jgi:DNA-binding NarL/FixJ family response regulator